MSGETEDPRTRLLSVLVDELQALGVPPAGPLRRATLLLTVAQKPGLTDDEQAAVQGGALGELAQLLAALLRCDHCGVAHGQALDKLAELVPVLMAMKRAIEAQLADDRGVVK